jgi:hypothetical protein
MVLIPLSVEKCVFPLLAIGYNTDCKKTDSITTEIECQQVTYENVTKK